MILLVIFYMFQSNVTIFRGNTVRLADYMMLPHSYDEFIINQLWGTIGIISSIINIYIYIQHTL